MEVEKVLPHESRNRKIYTWMRERPPSKPRMKKRRGKPGRPPEPVEECRLETAAFKAGQMELAREIQARKHPLAFDILDRFEIRDKFERGVKLAHIAQEYGTTTAIVKRVIRMKEDLPRGREYAISRQFFKLSATLDKLLEAVTNSDSAETASFSQQMLGVGILSDKVLAIRKGLDGEAAKKLELSLPSYAEREQLLEAIRQKFDQLSPYIRAKEVEALVVEEEDEIPQEANLLPASSPTQLKLFGED